MKKTKLAALGLSLGLVAAACGSDSDTVAADTDTTAAAVETTAIAPSTTVEEAMDDEEMTDEEMTDEEMMSSHLTVSFVGLEPLGDDAVYEGWLIVDGAPVSTGRFNVDADGGLVDDAGDSIESVFPIESDYENAAAVVISIEPFDDPDPAPAATKILGGEIVDGVAELSIAFPAALGTDFADVTGSYILATPSNGDGTDERSGVWFLNIPDPSASLVLPELPEGWAYEGWAVIDGVPVSTGTFLDPAAADDFDGFSGDEGSPPFPGEDFLVNAPDGLTFPTDLTGATIVISVEPVPDNSPAPFTLKPLAGEVPGDVDDHVNIDLGTGPAAPTGMATIG